MAKAAPCRQKGTDKPRQVGAIPGMYEAWPPTGRGQMGDHHTESGFGKSSRWAPCGKVPAVSQRRHVSKGGALAHSSGWHQLDMEWWGEVATQGAREPDGWIQDEVAPPVESKCRESQGRDAHVPHPTPQPRGLLLNDTPCTRMLSPAAQTERDKHRRQPESHQEQNR